MYIFAVSQDPANIRFLFRLVPAVSLAMAFGSFLGGGHILGAALVLAEISSYFLEAFDINFFDNSVIPGIIFGIIFGIIVGLTSP